MASAVTCTARSLGTQAQVPLSANPLQEKTEGGVKADRSLQLKARAQKPETTVFVSSSQLCDLWKLFIAGIQFLLLPMGHIRFHVSSTQQRVCHSGYQFYLLFDIKVSFLLHLFWALRHCLKRDLARALVMPGPISPGEESTGFR